MARPLVRFSAACFALLLAGKAWAQFPQGSKSGASPQASQALVTLAIPAVIGVNVAHNFVLDFSSATKCWGVSGFGAFPPTPPPPNGTFTYSFAVTTTSIPNTSNVTCPAAGAQLDTGTVQVLSTLAVNSRLQVSIVDGGQGAQATKFSDLIPDIFTTNRLGLLIPAGDTCGGGVKVSPFILQVAAANEVTAIPTTGWSSCGQKLQLTLGNTTAVGAGTATGTMTYTMVSP